MGDKKGGPPTSRPAPPPRPKPPAPQTPKK
jgi:hypothetical protein